jgi:hypothetical protein
LKERQVGSAGVTITIACDAFIAKHNARLLLAAYVQAAVEPGVLMLFVQV